MTTTAYANRVMDEHRNLLAQWESKWAAKGWRDQVCVTFRQQTGKFEVRGELKMKQTRYCATMAEVVDKVREVYGNGTLRHIETTPLCVGATCKRYAVV